MISRACTKCGVVKDAAGFQKCAGYADGYMRICKACSLVSKQAWRARAGETVDPVKARARRSKYNRTEKGKHSVRASAHNRRTRLADQKVSAGQYRELFASYCGLCVYCGDVATCVDHVVPLATGGPHALSNLAPACSPCNMTKNASSLLQFLSKKLSVKFI